MLKPHLIINPYRLILIMRTRLSQTSKMNLKHCLTACYPFSLRFSIAFLHIMLNNSFADSSLVILLWNANGLHNHKNELIITLNDKRIDLALISETHFTPNTKFKIPDYTLISSNHSDNTALAGAAILVKSTLKCTPPPIINSDFFQAALININFNHVPITFAATYCLLSIKSHHYNMKFSLILLITTLSSGVI